MRRAPKKKLAQDIPNGPTAHFPLDTMACHDIAYDDRMLLPRS
jgi:hypothetical protein